MEKEVLMRVLVVALAPLLLIACAPPTLPALHEIVLVGSENVRLSYFYGTPTAIGLGGETLELTRAGATGEDPLAVEGALRIGGRPYLAEPVPAPRFAPTEVRRVSATSDMRVQVGRDVAQVVYFDGSMWFTLL